MAKHDTLTLPQVASKLPTLLKGLPNRVRGLYLANNQKSDSKAGLGLCLEQAVERNPQGIAVIYEERKLTYREFNRWVNRIADYFVKSGTQKGDVVALFIENRPELIACIAALAKIGAVSALLNTSQRGKVLRHSIELVSAKRIVVGEELFLAINEVEEILPSDRKNRLYLADKDTLLDATQAPKAWTNLAAEAARCRGDNPASTLTINGADPFCYFYTSGTTGLPKAAILTHGRYMKAYGGVGLASIQLKPNDRAYVCLPFYHGTALIVGWGSVIAGAAGLVMARQFSASRFWDDVNRHQVTAFCYVGELCRYLLAQKPSPKDLNNSIRMMFGNGLRPNIWAEFKKRFGIEKVIEFYGSSEGNVGFLNLFNFDCTVGFTTVPYAIVEYDLETDQPIRKANGFLKKVKKGEAGLLLGEITDKSPFDGYTDPDKTEKTILRNVFKHGDAWFNTGDLMRDQGYRHAQFVDRLGDTFRWKGENVSTTEVENVLGSIPHVIDGVVYGVEIPNTNGRAGMALVRLDEGVEFDPALFYHNLSHALPAYAVPVFIRVATSLDTTGTFKYKKTDLKKQGFDLDLVSDQLWILLPGKNQYQRLSKEHLKGINSGQYRY